MTVWVGDVDVCHLGVSSASSLQVSLLHVFFEHMHLLSGSVFFHLSTRNKNDFPGQDRTVEVLSGP